MSKKNNAAAGAFEILKQLNGPLSVGIGTGSTTDCFTENFLPLLEEKIKSLYSSSDRTSELLLKLGFQVSVYKPNNMLDVYIDGADEVDDNLNLIKGGGGAHTNEKKLAKQAQRFICIVDDEKLVNTLGKFPLPIEIESEGSEEAISSLTQYSNKIIKRDGLSDNGNHLYDIHNFMIEDPLKIEHEVLSINGVVDVGIFSVDSPTTVVVGSDSGYRLIDS